MPSVTCCVMWTTHTNKPIIGPDLLGGGNAGPWRASGGQGEYSREQTHTARGEGRSWTGGCRSTRQVRPNPKTLCSVLWCNISHRAREQDSFTPLQINVWLRLCFDPKTLGLGEIIVLIQISTFVEVTGQLWVFKNTVLNGRWTVSRCNLSQNSNLQANTVVCGSHPALQPASWHGDSHYISTSPVFLLF